MFNFLDMKAKKISRLVKSLKGFSKHLALRRLTKLTAATCMALPLASCTGISPPTESDVEAAQPEVPALDTISDGQAYLSVGRNELANRKNKLTGLETGFDGAILGGVVLTGLGSALNWHSQTNTRAAIFTAAALGADSDLSIPQQVQILDKGLDALQCVEGKAAVDWAPLYKYNAPLEPVQADIDNLQSSIDDIPRSAISSSPTLESDINLAEGNITQAQIWLDTNAAPILGVNAGVQINVDSVLQTTVDQLDTTLPDGSAFSKIALSSLTSSGTIQTPPTSISTPHFLTLPTPSASNSGTLASEIEVLKNSVTLASGATLAAGSVVAPLEAGTQNTDPMIALETSIKILSDKLQSDVSISSTALSLVSSSGTITLPPAYDCTLSSS